MVRRSEVKGMQFWTLTFFQPLLTVKEFKMNTPDINTMPQPAYISYKYVLAYRHYLARDIELFSDRAKAVNRLRELSKNCVVTVGNKIIFPQAM